jgi:hypothetical protein
MPPTQAAARDGTAAAVLSDVAGSYAGHAWRLLFAILLGAPAPLQPPLREMQGH